MLKKLLLLGLLFAGFVFSASADETCVYASRLDDEGLAPHEHCGEIAGDQILLRADHLEQLSFDQRGLACVYTALGQVFYVRPDGRSQRAYYFDNGCDYYHYGLARGLEGGRMVYINEQLDIVLRPGFEWISAFDYAHAVVCNGPFGQEQYGEIILRRGGQCGLMDSGGRLVVAARHPVGDHAAFMRYINSHNDCPAPPVTTAQAALCHARRHADNMDYRHSDQWSAVSVVRQQGEWLIDFTEDNERWRLTLQADSADWLSLQRTAEEDAHGVQ